MLAMLTEPPKKRRGWNRIPPVRTAPVGTRMCPGCGGKGTVERYPDDPKWIQTINHYYWAFVIVVYLLGMVLPKRIWPTMTIEWYAIALAVPIVWPKSSTSFGPKPRIWFRLVVSMLCVGAVTYFAFRKH